MPEYQPGTKIPGKRKFFLMPLFLLLLITMCFGIFYAARYFGSKINKGGGIGIAQEKVKGMMILIEYKDTVGLVNYVNEMQKRSIPGVLHVSADFVEKNCNTIKGLLNYHTEIMGAVDGVLWDMPYKQQKKLISDAQKKIEACTGKPVKIISSTYMASDMTTLKVADELGIPYVTARGTTDTKATVYQVEGYKAKILSVSNISNVKFKYGSLCDYSFFQRSGRPEDMLEELNLAIEPLTEKEKATYGPYAKVTPVTHTNIGGYLKPWMDMWTGFWDSTKNKVEWVGLDEFMAQPDWTLPDWQVPINKNAPYTPEKIRPLTSYEDTEKVQNPCKVEGLEGKSTENITQVDAQNKIVVFHNGQGPMCLDFLEFIKTIKYPVEQHLTTDNDFGSQLEAYKTKFGKSNGVDENFGYYPIIFIGDKAYSGFDDDIKQDILKHLPK
jgi:hypothetical protein